MGDREQQARRTLAREQYKNIKREHGNDRSIVVTDANVSRHLLFSLSFAFSPFFAFFFSFLLCAKQEETKKKNKKKKKRKTEEEERTTRKKALFFFLISCACVPWVNDSLPCFPNNNHHQLFNKNNHTHKFQPRERDTSPTEKQASLIFCFTSSSLLSHTAHFIFF